MSVPSVWVSLRGFAVVGVVLTLSACGGGGDGCGGIAPSQRNVTVTPGDLTLEVGAQSSLAASVGGECVGTQKGIRVESSNPAVVTVAPVTGTDGVVTGATVTAVGAGSATVTATSTSFGVFASAAVTVRPPAVQSLALSATAVTLRERRTSTLRATVETTGQLTKRVRFTSLSPAVATVTAIDSVSATITAVAPGVADIEVVSEGDATRRATARVTVEPALVSAIVIGGVAASDSIVLASARQLTATVTDSGGATLTGRPVTWASSNTSVATVSSTGELRAVTGGTTQVTATVPIGDGSGNRTATATVRVFGTLQIAVTPPTSVVEEGQTVTLSAAVSGTVGIARSVTWESSNIGRATVSATGVVTGVLANADPVVIRARSAAVTTVVDSAFVTVLARSVPTVIDARPDVDTLSPNGTRALTATVRDQRNVVVANAPVVWRSLTPSLASVSASGVVTALANGTARIAAASPRTSPSDSLRDTISVLIVAPCTLVRPLQFNSTYNGAFDASTCRGAINFPMVDQFSLTSTTQRYYAVRLTPTFVASLVPLAIGNGLFGILPTDTAVTGLVVTRPGTFSLLVASPSTTTVGTYSFTLTENPNPAQFCVDTDISRGVSFDTALLPGSCQSRLIRILPALDAGQSITITATAQNFPVQIELREGTTVLTSSAASASGGTATITFNNTTFRFAQLRVIGTNGAVRITVN